MKLCDEKIQKHLLSGGKIKRRIETREIIIHPAKTGSFFDDNGHVFYISISDLTTDDWEIVETKYNWNKIIKDKVLCAFWNDGFEDCLNINTLRELSANGNFIDGNGCIYDNCRLFNPEDFNIAKDLKEYEK